MINLRSSRESLGISQSKLARISGVSRFKICTFELGGGSLSPQECQRIRTALETEAGRIRSITINPQFERDGQDAYSERWRSAFRGDGDRDSEMMPITIPS